jgi:hypothetical protein
MLPADRAELRRRAETRGDRCQLRWRRECSRASGAIVPPIPVVGDRARSTRQGCRSASGTTDDHPATHSTSRASKLGGIRRNGPICDGQPQGRRATRVLVAVAASALVMPAGRLGPCGVPGREPEPGPRLASPPRTIVLDHRAPQSRAHHRACRPASTQGLCQGSKRGLLWVTCGREATRRQRTCEHVR